MTQFLQITAVGINKYIDQRGTWNLSTVTIYFHQCNFCIDTLCINYVIHFSAFCPSSGMHIHYWLHCLPLT
jgi:hypothetical protein